LGCCQFFEHSMARTHLTSYLYCYFMSIFPLVADRMSYNNMA
jgi:hypothetical protein